MGGLAPSVASQHFTGFMFSLALPKNPKEVINHFHSSFLSKSEITLEIAISNTVTEKCTQLTDETWTLEVWPPSFCDSQVTTLSR